MSSHIDSGVAKIKETLRLPWVKMTGFVLLGLFVAFSLIPFFAGPPLLKSYLNESLSRKLGRKVSVGAVRVNPIMLSVAIEDFTLAELDGKTPFVAFKEAYVNAQLASVFFAGPVLSEIRLTEPRVNLVRIADNTYNFQDIIDRLSKKPSEPEKKSSGSIRFSLNNIRVIKGEIEFNDKPKGRVHKINDLNIAIPFLSNLFYRVDDYVDPKFSAVINGAPLQLSGKSKPFEEDRESSLNLKLSHLGLNEYLTYVPKKLYFTLPGGFLDADIKISFVQPKGKAPSLQVSGDAALHDLVMNESANMPVIRVKSLDVALGSIEPLVKRFTVDRIKADNLELFLRRDANGSLNLANLVEPDKEKKPMPYFLLKEIDLVKSVVHVRDDSLAKPFEMTLQDIQILVRNLTSEKSKTGQVEISASGPESSSLKAAADVVLEPLSVSKLNVQIAGLRLPQPTGKTEMVRIGQFGITGGAFDLERRSVNADEISLTKSFLNILRNRKGELNLSEIAGGSKTKREAASSGQAWQYAIKKLALSDIGVHWRDETPAAGTADIGVEKIQANVENISSIPNSSAKLSLKAQVGRTGNMGLDGSFVMMPSMSAKLQFKANGLPILPVQPYFADKVHIRVTNGTVGAQGSLNALMAKQTKQVNVQYQGNMQVNKFASVDNVNNNDFLKWETLYFGRIKLSTEPFNVNIGEISLSNFFSRLIINPDGTLNVQHVLDNVEEGKQTVVETVAATRSSPGTAAAPRKEKQVAAAKPAGRAAPPVKIALVSLQGGRILFSDRFIKPNYSANLTQIAGRVSGLSSNLTTTADVEIHGNVDGAAPMEIVGKINPLSGNLYLDLAASAKGVDLPTATPYSAHYAGYPILKGKLSMDVKYHIENRKLSAENRLILDQLTFGDKVESPTATKLPVLLAVALLKDRNGVIDVNLPISGSLDDPKFSVGGIIVRVIVNLITKAVTSPFALLGSIFGGGEQLSFIEFEPGRATLDKTGRDKISSLVKALENRPGLKLDITGRIDPATDKDGLRRRSMERKVKAMKLKTMSAQAEGPTGLDEIRIEPSEYPKFLKQAYNQEKFPKPRNVVGLAKDLPVSEMEKLMMANATVSDDDLRQLGLRRARVVADAIVKTGGIAADRVFVLEPKLKKDAGEKGPLENAKSSRVDFSLK